MSNQLQALLKSNKVNIAVDIDREKSVSNIKKGLSSLSKDIDGFNIDLGVKFNPNVKELNKELRNLQKKINDSKSVENAIKLDVKMDNSIDKLNKDIQRLQEKIQNAKTIKPIKLDVQIDVKGSAKKMTTDLEEMKRVLDKFKTDYSQSLNNLKKTSSSQFTDLVGDGAVKQMSSNLETIKREMNNAFGDGIVSTRVVRDAENNIQSLTATIKKETGEIYSSLFKVNEMGSLELVSQADVDKMQEQTVRAKKAITGLGDELARVKAELGESKAFDFSGKLMKQEFVSQADITNLKSMVTAEKELIAVTRKRKEFQDTLSKSMKSMSPEVSKVANEIKKLDVNLDNIDSKGMDKLIRQVKDLQNQYRADEQLFKARNRNLRETESLNNKLVSTYQKMTHSSQNMKKYMRAKDLIDEAHATSKVTKEVKDLTNSSNRLKEARALLAKIDVNTQYDKQLASMQKQADMVKKTIESLRKIGKFDQSDVFEADLMLKEKMATSEVAVKKFGQTLKRQLDDAKKEQEDLIKNFVLIEKHTKDASKSKLQEGIFKSLQAKDTTALKSYIGELKNGEVSTISIQEKTNKFGQAIEEVKVKMAGTGKTVEAYTFEMSKAGKATEQTVKETGRAIVDNENKSLGFMEQLGIAMKRVPSWILSMQSFYAVINSFKSVGKEIMEINSQMIEIQRVAGDGINVDSLFDRAVVQSKELGVNIHEVLDALSEFTRSYGDFTENQLLAVNKTAVMMTNVSDLTLSESVSNLVGTMNAFNIEAEESVHIVDALNEVDNNYSISTKQLADSLSKAGATAKTFGLTMEEVAGHTTAIGAVTMESGDIIGNSLKTIYSRITTMEPAIDILDSVGVSIHEMTEQGVQVKDVGDILGELAGQWSTLTDEQRQSIGVTIAGRNQLSRFLALMNNWGMATDATTQAINSQGSAVKEQAIYMESYEAKIAGVKTRFTELALSIGEAFMSDGMFIALDFVANLTEGFTKLVDKVGILPMLSGGLLAVAGNALKLKVSFGDLYKTVQGGDTIFKAFKASFESATRDDGKLIGKMAKEYSLLKDVSKEAFVGFKESAVLMKNSLKELGMSMLQAKAGTTGLATSQGALRLATHGVSTAFATAKTTVLGFLSSTVVLTGGLILLGVAIGKIAEKITKNKQKTKELMEAYDTATEKSLETYNSYGNNFDTMISEYERLQQAVNSGNIDSSGLERYKQLTNEISQALPNAVKYVDANGEAHLKSARAIKEERDNIAKLNKEKKASDMAKFNEKLKEQAENYELLNKKLKKYTNQKKAYEAQVAQGKNEVYDYAGMPTFNMPVTEKKYKESLAGMQQVQGALSMQLSESSVLIGENVRAWLTVDGQMKNVSSTGEGLIDTYSKVNQYTIESKEVTDDFVASQEKHEERVKKFGKALAESFDVFSDLEGQQLEKAKQSFDDLLGSLDSNFLKSEGADKKIKGLAVSIKEMATNSNEFDIDKFNSTLLNAGFSAEEAKKMIMAFGQNLENSAIKTQIANEEMSTYNETIRDMTTAMWGAIDAKSVMLGLDEGESQDISSRLEYLTAMKKMNEETWLSNSMVQGQLEELRVKTGLSREAIENNTVQIFEAYSLMSSKSSVEIANMSNMSYEQLREANKDMSEGGLQLLQAMLGNLKNGADGIQSALVMALSKGAKELDKYIDDINKSYERLKKDPSDTTSESLYFNNLKDQLIDIQGQFTLVEDKAGNMKLAMYSGEKSEYLDLVNGQLDELGIKLEVMPMDENGNIRIGFVTDSGDVKPLATLNDGLGLTQEKVELLKQVFNQFWQDQTEDKKSVWLNSIQAQLQLVDDQLKVVDQGTENAKIAFDDGSSSAWLDELNRQVKELGGELIQTTDEAGNLVVKVKDSSGQEFELFTQLIEGSKQTTEEASKAKKELTETQEKAKEGITVNVKTEGEIKEPTVASQAETQAWLDENPIEAYVKANSEEYEATSKKIDEDTKEPKIYTIDFKVLEQADGTVETTQARIETLLENVRNLEGGVGDVVSLIDNDLLSKNPLVGTLVDKILEIAKSAHSAKEQVDGLISTLGQTKIEITGEFKINGLTETDKAVQSLAENVTKASGTIKTAISDIQKSLNGLKVGKIDTSEVSKLETVVRTVMGNVAQLLSGYGIAISQAVNSANAVLIANTVGLDYYNSYTAHTVQMLITYWSLFEQVAPPKIVNATNRMLETYIRGTKAIADRTAWLQSTVISRLDEMGVVAGIKIQNMMSRMIYQFRAGTRTLGEIASDIPRQIGNGISRNMASATNSLQALADDMVKRFKSALGIHSPSRVFEELGGFVIQGLIKGLSNENLKSLGTKVFDDFSGGAMSSMEDIKMFMEGGWAGSPNFGGSFVLTSPFGGRGNEFHRGDDYGAPMGTPIRAQAGGKVVYSGWMGSYGNMIEIALGNGMSMRYAHNSRNMVPVGSTVKAGQIIGLVGSTGNSTGPHVHFEVLKNGQLLNPRGFGKFANGGLIEEHQFAEIGEEGQEMIIPLVPQRRQRGVDLWMETAERLGLDDELLTLKMLMGQRSSGYSHYGGMGGFGISDGESSESGAGGEGGAGLVKPQISNLFKVDKPAFSESAQGSLDALYKRDTTALGIDLTESYLTKANQKLKTLNENTLEYRNQIRVIYELNTKLLNQEKAQLKNTQNRQKAIENELKKLKNTGKHTEEQRKKWNELNQEYDNNSKTIWKLEESIEALNYAIQDNHYDNHIDYLHEIGKKWETIIENINKTSDRLNLELEKLKLTDPNDVGGQLKIRYDMLEQQMKLEKTYQNQVASFKKEYDHLVKKFGANDKRTVEAKKLLTKAEDDYNKSTLETLKLESSIKDEREKVAKESIGALKNYYKQMESLSKTALAKEKENLKKSHDEKIKYYDDEIAKINEVYDAKFKEREDEKNEKEYAEKMQKYNEDRIELMQKISLATKDNSLEGKKRLADLQKQLGDLNKEIADAQQARQDELWKNELENQKKQQLDKINKDKEAQNESYENSLKDIEKREKDIADLYNKMINDETSWKHATDAWNQGDTSILTELMNDMQDNLSQIMGGDGAGILGTENLTPDDLKELLGDSMIDVSNIWLNISDQLKELNSINKNLDDLNANDQKGGTVKNPTFTSGWKMPTTSQSKLSPDLSTPAPAKKPSNNGVKGHHTVVRGDTLWDLAKKYYNNYYDWKKIQSANGGINPYLLPIGKRLVIPFDTGGYTGDWTGNDGRIAMLHKKELVLNQNQTKDLLQTVSFLDRIKHKFNDTAQDMLFNRSGKSKGGDTIFGDINLTFEGFKGNRKEAQYVTDEILKAIKQKR